MPRLAVDLTAVRRSRDLRLVTIGQAAATLGTQAALVAIPYQVFVLTRSALLVGLVGAVELGPLIAGALVGGAWSDRFDRRTVLLAGQVVVSLTAGLLLVAARLDPHVGFVFALAGVLAGATAIVQVARAAVVPMKRVKALTAAVPRLGTAAGSAAASHTLMSIAVACAVTRASEVCPMPRRGVFAIRVKATTSCGLPSSVR